MIKWNTVTWYSRLLSLVFFVGVVPSVSFYLGRLYEDTVNTVIVSVSVGPVENALEERASIRSRDLGTTTAAQVR